MHVFSHSLFHFGRFGRKISFPFPPSAHTEVPFRTLRGTTGRLRPDLGAGSLQLARPKLMLAGGADGFYFETLL